MKKRKEFRCVECGKGRVRPLAKRGRQVRHKTSTSVPDVAAFTRQIGTLLRGLGAVERANRALWAQRVLTPARRAELYAALQADPPDGGLWTGPKVARYVADRWGVEVVPQTGWRWLVRLGFSLRVPRPRHPKAATAEQQRAWL